MNVNDDLGTNLAQIVQAVGEKVYGTETRVYTTRECE